MSQVMNVEEVLEIACQIERNGSRFYREAAERAALAESRAMLTELAKMEEGHERLFDSMKESLGNGVPLWDDADGTASAYLRAIAANHVFVADRAPTDVIPPDATARQVLRAALDAEFSSIAFFQGILDHMPPELGRDKLRAVIAEEQEHVVLINKKILEISTQGDRP